MCSVFTFVQYILFGLHRLPNKIAVCFDKTISYGTEFLVQFYAKTGLKHNRLKSNDNMQSNLISQRFITEHTILAGA